ncbi:MAG: purine-binding chemotaxis protein CheW [Sulfurimonas sp.]|nr:purine-binding chemotaxis protein CheW [Sulfurimonas sp.]
MDIDNENELLFVSDAKQYFFFKSGGDIYAIDAHSVSEMVEYQALTKVPMMSSYVKGVTNIRGEIIAVVDLLERFELGQTTIGKKTSLVIVNKIALIIDEIHEVDTIAEEDIKDTLDFGFKIEQRFIKNMARYNDEYIAILNCDEILNSVEISKIEDKS